MEAMEEWMDETERILNDIVNKKSSRRLSDIFTKEFLDIIQSQKTEYETKKILQNPKEPNSAKKHVTFAKIITSEVSNKTLTNHLLTIETKQTEKRDRILNLLIYIFCFSLFFLCNFTFL